MKTSSRLIEGALYSRDDLRAEFGIHDATLNTGIFQPAGSTSVWLFVTEEKTADRTQYDDVLLGDELHWEGQSAGRKDSLIIDHEINGLELLLFYRHSKSEYPDYAFRYEGRFRYVSHVPGDPSRRLPSRFVLRRCGASA